MFSLHRFLHPSCGLRPLTATLLSDCISDSEYEVYSLSLDRVPSSNKMVKDTPQIFKETV